MSVNPTASTDEERLAQLGYQQELHRRLSGFSNFAVSFSIISILAGAITSYGIAMNAGGPLAITIGWLFVGVMVTFVALAMADVVNDMNENEFFGSLTKVATKCGVHRDTVRRVINHLVDVAVLEVVQERAGRTTR